MKLLLIFYGFMIVDLCPAQKIKISGKDDVGETYTLVLTEYLHENQGKFKENKVLVEYNYLSTQDLPDRIAGLQIIQASIERSLFHKKRKNKHNFLRIVPMRYKNDKFIITIIEFEATLHKKKNLINQVNLGGKNYEFDCLTKELISLF